MPSARYTIGTQVSTEQFDDEIMIVDLGSGNYFSLAGTGAEIWRHVLAGEDAESILAALRAGYAGDAGVMARTLGDFLDELEAEALVVGDGTEAALAADGGNGAGSAEFVAPVLEKYTDMQELLLIDPIHEVSDEHGWPKLDS